MFDLIIAIVLAAIIFANFPLGILFIAFEVEYRDRFNEIKEDGLKIKDLFLIILLPSILFVWAILKIDSLYNKTKIDKWKNKVIWKPKNK